VNQESKVAGLAEEMEERKEMRDLVRRVRSSLGTCMDSGHARKWVLKLKIFSAVT